MAKQTSVKKFSRIVEVAQLEVVKAQAMLDSAQVTLNTLHEVLKAEESK